MKPPDLIRAALALTVPALFLLPGVAHASTPAAAPYGSAPAAATPAAGVAAQPAGAAGKPAAAPPVAAPPPPPAAEVDYNDAKDFLSDKKYDDALKSLTQAASDEGYTPVLANKVRILRAEILLSKRKPDPTQARALILRVLHEDREATLFTDVAPSVKTIADDLRDNHAFVLHELLPVTRPGRPIKIKARVVDPRNEVVSVKLHLRAHDATDYADIAMDHGVTGWTFFLRQPETLAPEGVTDEYAISYYFTGYDANGKVVDEDGSAGEPIDTLFSNAGAATVEVASGVDLNAVTKRELAPPVFAPPPPPETPWFARWYTITGASAVVAAVIVVVVVEATRPPPPLPAHLGVVSFPVTR